MSEVEVAGNASAASALTLGAAISSPIDNQSNSIESNSIAADIVGADRSTDGTPIDLAAMAEVNAAARAQAAELESVDVTPADLGALIGSVTIDDAGVVGSLAEAFGARSSSANLSAGAIASDATDADVEVLGDSVAAQDAATPDDRVDIDLIFEERASGIADLEAQALAVQEAQAAADAADAADAAAANLSLGEQAAVLAQELGTASSEAEAQAAWDAGYLLGGGANLSAFHSTILPCESGSQANRDTVVGRTDDWGRAQINRPVWRTTFQSLTGGLTFEDHIVHPTLNGYMAAHIEQVQGLSAWTCWRNR